jgi:hypothetical protein
MAPGTEDHVELLLQIAPKMKPEIDWFLNHARTPSSEADTFPTALNFFIDWLQEQQALGRHHQHYTQH